MSYATRDSERVIPLVRALHRSAVAIWRDQDNIFGGQNYGPRIVEAIRKAGALLVCCSDAALRSKNVKQEIQLAWRYDVPYLPVLLEPVSYPDQVRYWLEGSQWIDILDYPEEAWLPRVLDGLRALGVRCGAAAPIEPKITTTKAGGDPDESPQRDLEALWSLARLTDQLWPMIANLSPPQRRVVRDLGAAQDDLQREFALGSEVRLALEWDRDAHLTLLDRGTSGTLYCLCPSAFAPDSRIQAGVNYLPQAETRFAGFRLTGKPGREHLLALVTEAPLCSDWLTQDQRLPARRLESTDVTHLLTRLRRLEADDWVALATYFEVVPASLG